MEEMKVCKSCGGINETSSASCKYCGNSLFIIKKNKFVLFNDDITINIVKDLFVERKDFDSQYISNKHAYLFVQDEKLFVRDLKSTNGTYINDEQINSLEDVMLNLDDQITFANITFKVGVEK